MAREILITPVDIAETQEQTEKKHKWSPADVPGMIERRREELYGASGRKLFELVQERISSETS